MATLLQLKGSLSPLGPALSGNRKMKNEDDFRRPYLLKRPLYRRDIPALFAFLVDYVPLVGMNTQKMRIAKSGLRNWGGDGSFRNPLSAIRVSSPPSVHASG
jgi:hypothetical protein